MAADQVSSPKLMASASSALLLNSARSQQRKMSQLKLRSLSQKRFMFSTQKLPSLTLPSTTERTTSNSREREKVRPRPKTARLQRLREFASSTPRDTQDQSKFTLLIHSCTLTSLT